MGVGLQCWDIPGEIWNCPQYMEGKERPIQEAGHSRLVGGRFNKQGNLQGLS